MPKVSLTPEVLELVAHRLKVLAEPARLAILSCMRTGEVAVSEIVEKTGLGQANVSKHLQLLYSHGVISRRRAGVHVYYALADERVFTLCELMCDSIDAAAESRRSVLAS